MNRQNAEEAESTQSASMIATGRQKIHPALEITPWQSRQKHCPLKSWSKHYEARRMKKSQIIWHKWESYPLKTRSEQRGFLQPQFSQRCLCLSSTFQNFCNAVDRPLFFTLMQVKNCRGSNAITPTRLPAGSKMDLCWVTATWSLTAKPN